MGFLDALGIGSQPDQLSLAEVLSTIASTGGQYLMQRNGRIGGPLGAGLSTIGGLGGALAQRKQQQQQHQKLADTISKMPGVTDQQKQFFGQLVDAGVNPESFLPELLKNQFQGPAKPMFRMNNGREEAFSPDTGKMLYQMDPGQYTQSFKPGTEKKQGLLTGEDEIAAYQMGLGNDPSKYTPADAARLQEQLTKNKLAGQKPSVTNVNFGGYGTDASGNPVALTRSPKTGAMGTSALPRGVTPAGMLPKKAGPTTPATALKNQNGALAAATKELAGTGGFLGMGAASGVKVQARARDILAHSGLDADGYPLKDGQKVKMSDGTTLTWKNP